MSNFTHPRDYDTFDCVQLLFNLFFALKSTAKGRISSLLLNAKLVYSELQFVMY